MKWIVFILFPFSCHTQLRLQYPEVLDLTTTIDTPEDVRKTVFSDQGAWFAFAFADHKELGFAGPLTMTNTGYWMSDCIVSPRFTCNGKPVNLQNAKVTHHYYPGLIVQNFDFDTFTIEQKLVFVDHQTAIEQTTFQNKSAKKLRFAIAFKGRVFEKFEVEAIQSSNALSFVSKENSRYTLTFPNDRVFIPQPLIAKDKDYILPYKPLKIGKKQSVTYQIVHQFDPAGNPINTSQTNFRTALKHNEERWDNYLSRAFTSISPRDSVQQRLIVKCIETLMTNWRAPAGALFHDAVFPSVSYKWFYGAWSWDTWKQAVGIACFHPELAKNSIRCMFDYQNATGMIADCIYFDPSENNWRNTKSPLAAWAVYEVFRQTRDTSFVRELLPALEKYHHWWYRERDHDKNLWCEFGSTDGSTEAAAWESGMDNAVRFDAINMLQNNDSAWSIDQESVDLNAFLLKDKEYLLELQRIVTKHIDTALIKQYEILKNTFETHFYSESQHCFADRKLSGNAFAETGGTEFLIPFWAAIAEQDVVPAYVAAVSDTNRFYSYVPIPTIQVNHPAFNPLKGYWRGPVWLDQVYFCADGLKKYQQKTLSDSITKRLLLHAEGLLNSSPIRENYDPLTGKGLNALNFSWSASNILLLLKNYNE